MSAGSYTTLNPGLEGRIGATQSLGLYLQRAFLKPSVVVVPCSMFENHSAHKEKVVLDAPLEASWHRNTKLFKSSGVTI